MVLKELAFVFQSTGNCLVLLDIALPTVHNRDIAESERDAERSDSKSASHQLVKVESAYILPARTSTTSVPGSLIRVLALLHVISGAYYSHEVNFGEHTNGTSSLGINFARKLQPI